MTWIVVASIFIVAIAILVVRDDRRGRLRRRALLSRITARPPVDAQAFALASGTSLPLSEVVRIREIVAEYFQLDASRLTAEDDVWTTYGLELADGLEPLMQKLRQELGFDMASYDVERISTVGSIVRRCEEVGRIGGMPAGFRGEGAKSI